VTSDTFEVPIQRPDAWRFDDVEAASVLPAWKRDTTALRALFSESERRRLDRRRAARGQRTIVFLSYENRWGWSGGNAAVATMLPDELARAGESVIRLSPLHSALRTAPKRTELEPCGRCFVPFDGSIVPVSLHLATENDRRWYLFEAAGFFDADGGVGGGDPYVFSDETRADRDGPDSKLLRDALFAARAVPCVLATLATRGTITRNLVVHVQDWELAAAALTVKEALLGETLQSIDASVVLTLHNPYDHYLPDEGLGRITNRWQAEQWPAVDDTNRTVLARMIPLADAAISTVSRRFAQELTADPLQTGHFTRHYQRILARQGVIGIDNGAFLAADDDPTLERAVEMVRRGQVEPILERKATARSNALHRLERYQAHLRAAPHRDELIFGALDGGEGRSLPDLPNGTPIFLMTGRLDPSQKGFDVFAGAIEQLPAGMGRYIVSPMSPLAFDADVGRHLSYLRGLAERRPGEVVVMPFRLTEIYAELVQGVTWSVWPSLYEPFGGVTEPYTWLTPVVARATGGLVQQVVDASASPAQATGILYREKVPAARSWQEAEQRAMLAAVDPAVRKTTPLFVAQAAALARAISQATELYRDHRADYGRLLANLPAMCRQLDWPRSVADYRLWYDSASRDAG
jgi:glycogen synthase